LASEEVGPICWPKRSIAFKKVVLEPGEKQTVRISKGDDTLRVGNSPDALASERKISITTDR